jgi:hypothetical protein
LEKEYLNISFILRPVIPWSALSKFMTPSALNSIEVPVTTIINRIIIFTIIIIRTIAPLNTYIMILISPIIMANFKKYTTVETSI